VRFSELGIVNFRAIQNFHVDGLTDFVVVAGANGSGKSCILDAMRLLKSVYGGYQVNEWQQWFGEFGIDLGDTSQVSRMFRDPSQAIRISASIELAQREVEYLRLEAESVVEPLVWRAVTGQALETVSFSRTALATQFSQYGEQVARQKNERAARLRTSLNGQPFRISVEVYPDGNLGISPNETVEAIFQTYDPEHLGILDYHSASRAYQRENLGGLNLDVKQFDAQRRTQSLYNSQGKYQGVKAELAAAYVRELIAREAGMETVHSDLNETLKELFATFFPDKEYLGVMPGVDGNLSFPVRLSTGEQHDINEMSSGEKEIVYGYLRLRNSTPLCSTILLDEPELHLNPGLLQGFADFYHQHIGRKRGNQLWMVTHSDTLLRQAVGNLNYSVYHMTAASIADRDVNQAAKVEVADELEKATLDLVGDLAGYRPRAKVLLLEGGGESDIDVAMTKRLFPELTRRVNILSGGSKRRVSDLYEVLADTAREVRLADRFFVITDKDSGPLEIPPANASRMTWDVYHIENYLLEPKYVREATNSLLGTQKFATDDEVRSALKDCAQELLPGLLVKRLQKHINDRLVAALNIGGSPTASDAVTALLPSVMSAFNRVQRVKSDIGDEDSLRALEEELHEELEGWLNDDKSWVNEFPGRDILKRFIGGHLEGHVNYAAFRNLVLDRMVEDKFQPPGMTQVLVRVQEGL